MQAGGIVSVKPKTLKAEPRQHEVEARTMTC